MITNCINLFYYYLFVYYMQLTNRFRVICLKISTENNLYYIMLNKIISLVNLLELNSPTNLSNEHISLGSQLFTPQ